MAQIVHPLIKGQAYVIALFIIRRGLFLFSTKRFFFFFSSIIQTSLHILPGQCPLLSATLSENRRVP